MNDHTLYIVGNGFDIWHGIPSRFAQFKAYVKDYDRDLLQLVENYLPVDEDWNELETSLAGIDLENMIVDLEHFMTSYGSDDWGDSGHHDFQFEIERVVERLSSGLRQMLIQWIHQLPIPTRLTAPSHLRTLDPTARFLNFNYTQTLQKIYGVPDEQVLHIHGAVHRAASDLVLGHAWNPSERKSLNDHADVEEVDTRLIEAREILDEYFSKTFKPSSHLIDKYQPSFEQLVSVDDVCILGHSLSSVDWAYFKALLVSPGISSAQWRIAYLNDEDRVEKCRTLLTLGVQPRNIVPCLWSEL